MSLSEVEIASMSDEEFAEFENSSEAASDVQMETVDGSVDEPVVEDEPEEEVVEDTVDDAVEDEEDTRLIDEHRKRTTVRNCPGTY